MPIVYLVPAVDERIVVVRRCLSIQAFVRKLRVLDTGGSICDRSPRLVRTNKVNGGNLRAVAFVCRGISMCVNSQATMSDDW